jgi:hypothetical protein
MTTLPAFVQGPHGWLSLAQQLKLTACRYCKVVGALLRHGFLYGFDEQNPRHKTVRAQRIFCSNRNARPGCGRTFSVWLADKIRRLSLTATFLWHFLRHAANGSVRAASCALPCHLEYRSLLRIWQRFLKAQSKLRTALCSRCLPPHQRAQTPMAQVLAHLQGAFHDADAPIAAYQLALQAFFL